MAAGGSSLAAGGSSLAEGGTNYIAITMFPQNKPLNFTRIQPEFTQMRDIFKNYSEAIQIRGSRLLDRLTEYINSIGNFTMNANKKQLLLEGSGDILKDLDAVSMKLTPEDQRKFKPLMKSIEQYITLTYKEAKDAYLKKVANTFGGRRTRKQKQMQKQKKVKRSYRKK